MIRNPAPPMDEVTLAMGLVSVGAAVGDAAGERAEFRRLRAEERCGRVPYGSAIAFLRATRDRRECGGCVTVNLRVGADTANLSAEVADVLAAVLKEAARHARRMDREKSRTLRRGGR